MEPRLFRALVALLLLSVAACAKAEPPRSNAASATGDATAATKVDRALVVTVEMSLKVTDALDASSRVRAAAEDAGGYVSTSSASGARDDATASMDLRVPAAKLPALRKRLAELGDVESQSEKVDDVTDQRADLDARLRNARTAEARLLEIMQQKTGSIADVVAAEKELARVRENVEVLDAQRRTLEGQIAMATVHVTLNAPSSAAWQTPGRSIAAAFHLGVRAAEALTVYSAMAIAAVTPVLVPIGVLGALAVVLTRRRRRLAS